MPFLEARGARLFFTDEGQGATCLFVHGYTCDSHDWSWQLPWFADRFRVVALDLRGHGKSGTPAGGYEPRQLAGDVAALIDHLGCGPVVAFGHSLGGVIVSALAVEHPNQVAAVVHADPAYHLPAETAPPLLPLVEASDPATVAAMVQAMLSTLEGLATPAPLRVWHRRRAAGLPPQVLQDVLRPLFEPDPVSVRSAAADAYLARRACPILTVCRDPKLAAADAALFTDKRSRVVTWEGFGHWLHQESPGEFNAVVGEWLAGLNG